jgi:hypothetical protein
MPLRRGNSLTPLKKLGILSPFAISSDEARLIPRKAMRLVRLMVRTAAFQAVNRGSIPLRATT